MNLINNNRVDARELYTALGVGKEFINWIKEAIERYEFIENEDYTIRKEKIKRKVGGTLRIEYSLTIDAATIITQRAKTNQQVDIYKYLMEHSDIVVAIRERERKEILFGKMLFETFDGICEFESQYMVFPYRIDFYNKECNIAIEYDEEYHDTDTQQNKDKNREQFIKKQTGCKFIRVKIGEEYKGINEILKAIFS